MMEVTIHSALKQSAGKFLKAVESHLNKFTHCNHHIQSNIIISWTGCFALNISPETGAFFSF